MSHQPPENPGMSNLPPQGQPFKPGTFVPQASDSQPSAPQLDGPPPPAVQPVGQPVPQHVEPATTQSPAPVPPTHAEPSDHDEAPQDQTTPLAPIDEHDPTTAPQPAAAGAYGADHRGPDPQPSQPTGPHPQPSAAGAPPGDTEELNDGSGQRRKPLIIALVALLVLLLAGGLGLWAYQDHKAKEEARIAAENKAAAEKQAGESVATFLTAVSEGKATEARDMVQAEPENADLVTDEALAAAQQTAPIEDISVVSSEGNLRQARVTVTYTVGGEETESQFEVVRDSDSGPFQIKDAYSEVGVDAPAGVPVTLNGVPVKAGDTVPVLFGTWTLAGTNPNIKVTSTQPAVVRAFSPDDKQPQVAQATAALSPAGTKLFRKQLSAQLTACSKKKELAPSGCPWQINEGSGLKVNTASIAYSFKDSKYLSKVKITLAPGRENVAQATISVPMNLKARATQGGRSGTVDYDFTASGKYEMDLTAGKPRIKLLQ